MWAFSLYFTLFYGFMLIFINIMKLTRINEELTDSDVKKQISLNMDSKAFKDAVDKIVAARMKNNPELEDKVVEISRNVLTQLFKTLWVKRGVWRNNLSNKSS